VGSTSYAIPFGAIFVDGTNGSSSGSGTITSPLKTMEAAVALARSGQTIVIRAGVYNETVTIPSTKSLTIQAYPKEAVWFDGSIPVTSWTASGSRWISGGWTAEFSRDIDGMNSRFIDPAFPNADRPDQLFLDGIQLTQVAGAGDVVPGTFAIDYASDTITLGTNPAGHAVRVSNKVQAFNVLSSGTTLQGFGVRNYATPYAQRAAVRMQNDNEIARNLVILDNAMIGLAISRNAGLIENVTTQRNGLLGIGINASYGLVIKNSVVKNNDLQRFKVAPVSGGIKITRSRGVTVVNNDVSNNFGSGIWCDESCYNMNVSGNTANYNQASGIILELSDTGIVANNQTVGNDKGIQIYNTGNIRIFNNDIGGNTTFGIKLAQDERRNADPQYQGRDPRRTALLGGTDPTVTWITQNIEVVNNTFGTGGLFSIYGLDSKTHRSVDDMNVTITGNLFSSRASGGPHMVAWGGSDNHSLAYYETPQALAGAKNPSWVNAMTSANFAVQALGGEEEAAASIAIPLPADVAKATGLPAGSKRIGSYN
jgi:trimeric autotransporter adhesin